MPIFKDIRVFICLIEYFIWLILIYLIIYFLLDFFFFYIVYFIGLGCLLYWLWTLFLIIFHSLFMFTKSNFISFHSSSKTQQVYFLFPALIVEYCQRLNQHLTVVLFYLFIFCQRFTWLNIPGCKLVCGVTGCRLL